MRIWKWPLPDVPGSNVLEVPNGTKFISTLIVDGTLCVYGEVPNRQAATVKREVRVCYTGEAVEASDLRTKRFLGTQAYNDATVVHVYGDHP